MSVLIKGMEMPKSCDKCPFCDGEAWCIIPGDWRLRYNFVPGEILPGCPLVPVPDHGRLIDADAMIERIREAEQLQPELAVVYEDECNDVILWLATEPVIIPADKEGEG